MGCQASKRAWRRSRYWKTQGRIKVSDELWERIGAKAGDEICVFDVDGKLDICTKAHYDEEDHDISSIEGLETTYFVEGL